MQNGLVRAARTAEGHDVIVRVLCVADQGRTHLNILRRIATGECSLLSNNHALPMFREIVFEDIIFGVFPKAHSDMDQMYGCWANNSVGDIMDMILQALEVRLVFLL